MYPLCQRLHIPLVVLYGPPFCHRPDIFTISDEIAILGKVFGKTDAVAQLATFLEDQVLSIAERTRGIDKQSKPAGLIFGPAQSAKKNGGAGVGFGLDTIESYFIESLANARNAMQTNGYFRTLSIEHLFDMDPDVIVLSTAGGCCAPERIYDSAAFKSLRHLKAVKNHRLAALPFTPWNCAKRLEYPIDVMVIATAALGGHTVAAGVYYNNLETTQEYKDWTSGAMLQETSTMCTPWPAISRMCGK